MANVLSAAEDVCNAALVHLGYKLRVGSMFDGSEQSKVFLDIYGQTRDQLLRQSMWGFAEFDAPAVIAAGTPPFNWAFQYDYPSDCIQVRNLINPNGDPNNPTPSLWKVATLTVAGSETKVVLSQVPNATIIYTRQITNPLIWDTGFTQALIVDLALAVDLALVQSPDLLKLLAPVAEAETVLAASMVG